MLLDTYAEAFKGFNQALSPRAVPDYEVSTFSTLKLTTNLLSWFNKKQAKLEITSPYKES